MRDCCPWHRSGGHELMACTNRDARTLAYNDGERCDLFLGCLLHRGHPSVHVGVQPVPGNELAKLKTERDEMAAHLQTMCAKVERLLPALQERNRLRDTLEPTTENVEVLAQFIFAEQWTYPGVDGANPEPMPTWEVVIFEGSAEGWRNGARAVLGFLRARAGLDAAVTEPTP